MKIEIKKGKKCIIVKVDEGNEIDAAQFQDGFQTEEQAFKALLDHIAFYYKPEGSDFRVDIMKHNYLDEESKDSFCKHCYQDLPLDRMKPHEWEKFDNPKDKEPVTDEKFIEVKDVNDSEL